MPEASSRQKIAREAGVFLELVRWIPIGLLVGGLAGTASALLLVSLDLATTIREHHPWLILLLGPAGALVGLLYKHLGASVEAGNNLILEQTHQPTATVPLRMTPLIIVATFITHVFGGSAGREGTAVQTGASLAAQLGRPFRMSSQDRRILLMTGISAGFGSVFGTPLAGAVFGIEVLAIGRLSYDAIWPCFLASFVGDLVTQAWGVQHTIYSVTNIPSLTLSRIGIAVIAGSLFGLTARGFAMLTHAIGHRMRAWIASAPMRPFVGGVVLTALIFGLGFSHTSRYIGLGLPVIHDAFSGKVHSYDFLGKLGFTALTLGTGFKGGEVTPLFYIGATLGNALSRVLPLSPSLLAAMGFAGVFAGAANTPIASTLLAVELFGAEAAAYTGIACVISYLCSGHSGIYESQRIGRSKFLASSEDEGLSLSLLSEFRESQLREVTPDAPPNAIRDAGKSEEPAGELQAVLRLYFSASAMRRADTWWKRFAPQTLGEFLLEQARQHGIQQALLQRVLGGHLHNQDLDADEDAAARSPLCLELVGEEGDLQAFLDHNQLHLAKVRIVFLRGQQAAVEAANERQEILEALHMEHGADPEAPVDRD